MAYLWNNKVYGLHMKAVHNICGICKTCGMDYLWIIGGIAMECVFNGYVIYVEHV